MIEPRWLTTPDFARLAAISRQKARDALAGAHRGKVWRGHLLEVRAAPGRGGRSGLRYEVKADSLPPELAAKIASGGSETAGHGTLPAIAAVRVAKTRRRADPGKKEWARRHELISPALATSRGSRARAEAVAQIAAQNGISERTVRKYLTAYEAAGSLHGLRRRGRQDRGVPRVFVSRTWDKATSFDDATRQKISAEIERYIRSVWAADKVSWRRVQQLATKELVKLSRRAGCEMPDTELIPACTLPRNVIEEGRPFSILAIQKKDAKLFADKHVYRIQRIRNLRPMQVIVGDVHPIDVLVTRPDGSTCTARAITWQDVATNRVFVTVVILEKGKGICREHVIASFIEMTQHPEWGMPGMLYLDNGSEYTLWPAFLDDAMRLATFPLQYLSDDTQMHTAVMAARRSMTVKALPYRAPSKPVEGLFSILEAGFFCLIPGWIGGNRMKKKSANVGRAPIPFAGDAASFDAAIQDAIAAYDVTPQTGHLNGKSPRQAFSDHVAAGWGRTDIDRHALEAVFAFEITRCVKQGKIKFDGQKYTDPALDMLNGQTLRVRVPIVGNRQSVTVLDDRGSVICVAVEDTPYPFIGAEGPNAQAARASEQHRALAGLRKQTDQIDLNAELREFVDMQPPAAIPESAGVIHLSDEIDAIAAAQRALPASEARKPVNEGAALWAGFGGSRRKNSSAGGQ